MNVEKVFLVEGKNRYMLVNGCDEYSHIFITVTGIVRILTLDVNYMKISHYEYSGGKRKWLKLKNDKYVKPKNLVVKLKEKDDYFVFRKSLSEMICVFYSLVDGCRVTVNINDFSVLKFVSAQKIYEMKLKGYHID